MKKALTVFIFLICSSVYAYDIDESVTKDFATTVNGTLREGQLALNVYGWLPVDGAGVQILWWSAGSYYGSVVTTFRWSDGTVTHEGNSSGSNRRFFGPYLDSIEVEVTTQEGDTHSLTVSLSPPDPCGPLDFEKTYSNSTSITEEYQVYLGESLIDDFRIPPYSSHTYKFHSNDECESLTIIRLNDGIPSDYMDQIPPDAPIPNPDPEEPPPVEEPEPEVPFEDSDAGAAASAQNVDEDGEEKSDVEKEAEVDFILWKGTDARMSETNELLQKIADSIEGEGEGTAPAGTGEGQAIEFSGNADDVLGLENLIPSMPTVTAPSGSQTAFGVNIGIPGGGNVQMDFDLTNYSGPISIFRAILAAALTLTFFLVVVKTIREAFA